MVRLGGRVVFHGREASMSFEDLRTGLALVSERSGSHVLRVDPQGDDALVVLVETTPGCSHLVFIRDFGAGEERLALCIALGVRVPEGRPLPIGMALELLKRNAVLPLGSWCVMEHAGEQWVALKETLLLDHLDAGSAVGKIYVMANTADGFEAELGRDDY